MGRHPTGSFAWLAACSPSILLGLGDSPLMNPFLRAVPPSLLALLLLWSGPTAGAQIQWRSEPQSSSPQETFSSSLTPLNLSALSRPAIAAPPAPTRDNPDNPVEPSATNFYQAPFSRMGIGADVSPLGVGIKTAIILNTVLDARLMGNYFSFDTGRVEVDNINVDAKLHLASAAASLDWYPFRSVWRFSVGTLFYNDNKISGSARIVSGNTITLNGQDFYSANPNPVTGATPLTGTGVLGLHTHEPALILSGGFGRFIPRSQRHWSFPSEFGVAFMGSPSVNATASGWACLDAAQAQCANLSDPTSPVATQFHDALQAQITKWRRSVSSFSVYPLFSYSVVYSFNLP